jgi:hypothetical protein
MSKNQTKSNSERESRLKNEEWEVESNTIMMIRPRIETMRNGENENGKYNDGIEQEKTK